MEKYKILDQLGHGSYGVVWRAFDTHSNQYVAIKQLFRKHESWNECMDLIEVKALLNNNHPNIVELKDILKKHDTVYLVFEHMECDLFTLSERKILSETMIRNICFQIFQGLAYIHRNGYIHRDLKPENILVNQDMVKIGDFGLAREINSNKPYDYNVTTEPYRAPEVFLRSPTYDSAIDMWAMGVIMTELFTNNSMFSCCETYGLLGSICNVLGTPTETTWLKGVELAKDVFYEFPKVSGVGVSALLPNASSDAVNLIGSLLSWDPSWRPTAEEALQHPFFHGCYRVTPMLMNPKLKETRCLEDGFDEVDLDDLARFLPANLFDF